MAESTLFVNYYMCQLCSRTWIGTSSQAVTADCPHCETYDIKPFRSQIITTDPLRLVISMEGGIIQEILSNFECDVMIIDHDIDGVPDESLSIIPQTTGTTALAYVVNMEPNIDKTRTNSLFEEVIV